MEVASVLRVWTGARRPRSIQVQECEEWIQVRAPYHKRVLRRCPGCISETSMSLGEMHVEVGANLKSVMFSLYKLSVVLQSSAILEKRALNQGVDEETIAVVEECLGLDLPMVVKEVYRFVLRVLSTVFNTIV